MNGPGMGRGGGEEWSGGRASIAAVAAVIHLGFGRLGRIILYSQLRLIYALSLVTFEQ